MKTISIRQALIDDESTILRFQQGVVAAERPFDRTLKPGAIQYYDIPQMLQAPNVHFVVAEWAGKAIGCGFARIEFSKTFLLHEKHGYLGLMYVEPEFRGQGVNARIMESLKAWCRSQAVVELRLDVYRDNAAAIKAYEKTGFAGHMLEMRMNLNEN